MGLGKERLTHPHFSTWDTFIFFSVIAPPSNPCLDGSHTCAPEGQAQCIHQGGSSFSCACLPGFVGTGHECSGECLWVSLDCSLWACILVETQPLPSCYSHSLGVAKKVGIFGIRKSPRVIPGTGMVAPMVLECGASLCRLEGLRLRCLPTISHPHKTLGETGSGVCVALASLELRESPACASGI